MEAVALLPLIIKTYTTTVVNNKQKSQQHWQQRQFCL